MQKARNIYFPKTLSLELSLAFKEIQPIDGSSAGYLILERVEKRL